MATRTMDTKHNQTRPSGTGNRMEKKKAKGRTLNNKNYTMKNTARRVGAPGVRGLEANPRERRRGVNPEHDNR